MDIESSDEQHFDPEVYRALFEFSTDLIAILDDDGTIRYASPSYRRAMGYSPSEIRGTSAVHRVHPDDAHIVQNAFELLKFSRDKPVTIQARYRRADGQIRHVEILGTNLIDHPVVRGYLVNTRDITERVAAERQLRDKETQYRDIFESTIDGLAIFDSSGRVVEANPAYCHMHGYNPDEILGIVFTELIHAQDAEIVTEALRQVTAGTSAEAHFRARRKDDTYFDAEGRGTILSYQGGEHVLAVIRDVTERVQAYELLEQRVAERTRELSTLLSISHNVAARLELQPLLELILDEIRTVMDYTGAGIGILDGATVQIVGYRGPTGQPALQIAFSPERWPGWDLLKRGEVLIVDDVRSDTAEAALYRAAVGTDRLDSQYAHVTSFLAVPMILKEQIVGGLSMAHDQRGYYTERHADLALAIGDQAAIAIENARLYRRAQEVAVLEERQRLSRELHDSVSQALYGIALGAQTARAQLDRDPGKAVEPLEYVLQQAQTGLAEMRALIFELRPEALELEGLVAALLKQAEAIRNRNAVELTCTLDPEPDVPLETKDALYRIAQEALNNAVKHARASRLEVRMTCAHNTLELQIRDNGQGFNTTQAFPGHLGLQTMRERASRVGGTFRIESASGQGSAIIVHLDLPR